MALFLLMKDTNVIQVSRDPRGPSLGEIRGMLLSLTADSMMGIFSVVTSSHQVQRVKDIRVKKIKTNLPLFYSRGTVPPSRSLDVCVCVRVGRVEWSNAHVFTQMLVL